jgi:uncharacterized membrane protein
MTDRALIGAIAEVVGFAAAVFAVGVTVKSYALLPEQIAVHFNLRCEPNRWGPRGTILIFPIIAVVLFITLTLLNPIVGLDTFVLGPGAARNPAVTTLTLAAIIVMMASVTRAMIAFNLGETRRMASPAFFIPIVFGALAIAMALYFDAMSVP